MDRVARDQGERFTARAGRSKALRRVFFLFAHPFLRFPRALVLAVFDDQHGSPAAVQRQLD